MNQIVLFFVRSEGWFYFIGLIIAVISLVNFLRNRSQWKLAVFSLEQEIVRRKSRSAITWLVLSVVFIIGEFSFVTFASVKYPNIQMPTPTVSLEATPTLSILGGVEAQTVVPGTTLAQSALSSEGCKSGSIDWSNPRPGTEVRSQVDLVGTVNVPNLGYYKLEFRPLNSTTWQTISGADTTVVNDGLGAKWNIADLTPGDYELGLTVLDNQNVAYPDCIIIVHVVAP
jgi:hypothetical protein